MPPSPGSDAANFRPGDHWVVAALRRMGIAGAHSAIPYAPLAGGVSSDIFRVELPSATICVKRALPKLKVAADWQAPVARSRSEAAWMRAVAAIAASAAPRILGEDREAGAFAMEYFPPSSHPLWKAQLRDGVIDVGVA